jgi:hypothetical protein
MQLGSDVDHAAFHVSFGLLSLILNPLCPKHFMVSWQLKWLREVYCLPLLQVPMQNKWEKELKDIEWTLEMKKKRKMRWEE